METILQKLQDAVGAKDVDFKKHDWYLDYTWTPEQQDEFALWMTNYLYNNAGVRKKIMTRPAKNKKLCKKFADMFIFNYGWKTSL